MKQVWQAEDGKIFKTEKECSFYEEQKRMHQEFLEDNKFNQGGIIVGSLNLNHKDICKNLLELIKN